MVVAACLCLPVVAGAYAQHDRGWVPVGDEAAVAWLSYDAAHADLTLVGMPSTIGQGDRESQPYHLGPLLFWTLAPVATLWRWSATGFLSAAAVVNTLSIVTLVWFMRRRIGDRAMLVALAPLPFMLGSLGRLSLASIINPTIVVVPLACFVVLAWSIACGDAVALPFAAFVGSFAVQSHFVYAPLVGALSVWALMGFVLTRRAERSTVRPTNLRRPVVASLVVLAVAWSAPLYDQATRHPGNFVTVVRAARASSVATLSLRQTFAFSIRSSSATPLWLHQDFDYAAAFRPPDLVAAVSAIALLASLVVLASWLRGRDRALQRMAVTALTGIAASAFTLHTMPRSFGFVPASYTVKHFWVTGWFAWSTLLVVGYRLGSARRPSLRRGAVSIAAVVLVVGSVVAAFGIGRHDPRNDRFAAVRELARAARHDLPRNRAYLVSGVVSGGGAPFAGMEHGVGFDLRRHGFDVRVPPDDPYLARNHGIDPRTHPAQLVLVGGPAAPDPRPGFRRIAVFGGDERARHIARLETQIVDLMRTTPPRLTARGREVLRSRSKDDLTVALAAQLRLTRTNADLHRLVRSGGLAGLATVGLIDVDPRVVALSDEFVALRKRQWAAFVSDTPEPHG